MDLHVDRQFRVFANSRYPFIDVRREMPDLTELVEVEGDEPFILHPGEFVLGSTFERVRLPDDLVARLEGKSSLGRLGPADPLDGGLRRPGVGRVPHARALERREPADHDLPADEDRAGSRSSGSARRPRCRTGRGRRSKYQGQRGPTASRFFEEFGDRGGLAVRRRVALLVGSRRVLVASWRLSWRRAFQRQRYQVSS